MSSWSRLVAFSLLSGLAIAARHSPVAAQARDLDYPGKATPVSSFSSPRMALLKPEGAGPFPALVLHHQCGAWAKGNGETSPSPIGLGAAKAAGSPVEWHVYPNGTHCWDCKDLKGFSKVDVRGRHVAYRYDVSLTSDSGRRLFQFLERAGVAPNSK
jgi:hypothetical protein